MKEQFIERATSYELTHGLLTIYETNCPCKDVKFFFEENVFTLMLSGHKRIVTERASVEFFPETFYIPEKHCVQTLAIPNASFDNPTKCIVLTIDKDFQAQFYRDLRLKEESCDFIYNDEQEEPIPHFMSNDKYLIENLKRIYKLCSNKNDDASQIICTFYIKELLLRLFQTKAISLLREVFEENVPNRAVQSAIKHIKENLNRKITLRELANIGGLGLTSFNNKFKSTTGFTPIEYLFNERIKHAKVLILKDQMTLKEIAFHCGFNSYEYFCSSFKKIEQIKPSEFKKLQAKQLVLS